MVCGEGRGADVTEYAINKGDDLLKIGTLDELAEFRKVKRETIFFYATPTYRKRTTEKGIRVIKLD